MRVGSAQKTEMGRAASSLRVVRVLLEGTEHEEAWRVGRGRGLTCSVGPLRLRVGYIMADFRHHVTAHLLQVGRFFLSRVYAGLERCPGSHIHREGGIHY